MLDDGLRVERVSRRHSVDGHPTIIRVAYPEGPLWQQFRSHLLALILPAPAILLFAGLADISWRREHCSRFSRWHARRARSGAIDLHEEAAGQPVGRGTGRPGASLQLPAAAPERQSFEQLRRFTSDASHELRTPLAAMRSVGEVGLQKECSPARYHRTLSAACLKKRTS